MKKGEEGETQEEKGSRIKSFFAWKVGIIKSIFSLVMAHKVAVIVALTILAPVSAVVGYQSIRFMETPAFCAILICHDSMQPYNEVWAMTSHSKINSDYRCMDCHSDDRVGPIKNMLLAELYGHNMDAPPTSVGIIQGKRVETEFDPHVPHIPNERCARCHAPDAVPDTAWPAKGARVYPLTINSHFAPINVRSEFEYTLNNPRGTRYECKICHSTVAHPTNSELLPKERGEKYNFIHPGFPTVPTDIWGITHYHLFTDNEGDLAFVYSGTVELPQPDGTTRMRSYRITADELQMDDVQRDLDLKMCEICHKGEWEPEHIDAVCQGCHSEEHKVTHYKHVPHNWLVSLFKKTPNINDYYGVTGEVGGGSGEH